MIWYNASRLNVAFGAGWMAKTKFTEVASLDKAWPGLWRNTGPLLWLEPAEPKAHVRLGEITHLANGSPDN